MSEAGSGKYVIIIWAGLFSISLPFKTKKYLKNQNTNSQKENQSPEKIPTFQGNANFFKNIFY